MWSTSGMYVGIIQMSLSGSCLVPGSWSGKEERRPATAVYMLCSRVPHPHSSHRLLAGFATGVLQPWWNITPPILYQAYFACLHSRGLLQRQVQLVPAPRQAVPGRPWLRKWIAIGWSLQPSCSGWWLLLRLCLPEEHITGSSLPFTHEAKFVTPRHALAGFTELEWRQSKNVPGVKHTYLLLSSLLAGKTRLHLMWVGPAFSTR